MRAAACLLLIGGALSCSPSPSGETAIASPSVSIPRTEAVAGRVIDVTYRFAVAPDAQPLEDDHVVFVHVFDARGERVWTGDHEPPIPTGQWKPGAVVEYVQPMSVPRQAPTGRATIELGLYLPRTGARLPLSGSDSGQRSYHVASLEVIAPTDPLPIFVDGWYDLEAPEDDPGVEWHWSAAAGTIWLRNPKRDAVFVLEVDQPMLALGGSQQVVIRIGTGEAATFSLAPGRRHIQRIPVPASQLGDEPIARITVATNRTFVPSQVPGAASGDTRELGVRVFSAYFESP